VWLRCATRAVVCAYPTLFRSSLELLPRLKRIVVVETKGFRNYPETLRDRICSFAEMEALGRERAATHGGLIDEVLSRQTLDDVRSEEHTSELQLREKLVCRLL